MDESESKEFCDVCGMQMERFYEGYGIMILGTRDSFGIKNAFVDGNGNEIDTWGKWEKAGYKDAKDVHKGDMLAKIKRKEDKVKFDKKQKFSVKV